MKIKKCEILFLEIYAVCMYDLSEIIKYMCLNMCCSGKLLVRQAKAHLIVAKVNDVMKEKYYNHKQQVICLKI